MVQTVSELPKTGLSHCAPCEWFGNLILSCVAPTEPVLAAQDSLQMSVCLLVKARQLQATMPGGSNQVSLVG